jgi:putative transposase
MVLAIVLAMFPRRPGRIAGFSYIGLHRYSATICTHLRKRAFENGDTVELALVTIRQCASTFAFAIYAYCFMPDHLHLVLAATHEGADFQRFMANWKQRVGYHYKQRTGECLWQESYFDHVLRDDEETDRAMRYVLENPVRKGLVTRFEDYPYAGSDVVTSEQLQQLWHQKQG